MSFTDFLENSLLDHIFTDPAYTPPATLYLALSTTTPTDAGGNFTEPSGNNYSRVAAVAANFSAAAAGSKTNTAVLDFPQASGSWGTLTYFGIYDASTSGNLIMTGVLSASVAIASGDIARFAASSIVVTLD